MVHEDFFFIINYLSTIHTSVDDLEFFLQVTKSLDHLRREGGGGHIQHEGGGGGHIQHEEGGGGHIQHFSPCPNENKNGGTFHRGERRTWEQG